MICLENQKMGNYNSYYRCIKIFKGIRSGFYLPKMFIHTYKKYVFYFIYPQHVKPNDEKKNSRFLKQIFIVHRRHWILLARLGFPYKIQLNKIYHTIHSQNRA